MYEATDEKTRLTPNKFSNSLDMSETHDADLVESFQQKKIE